jgi:hypothetical protein
VEGGRLKPIINCQSSSTFFYLQPSVFSLQSSVFSLNTYLFHLSKFPISSRKRLHGSYRTRPGVLQVAQGAFPVCPHIVTVQQGGCLTIPKGSVPYFPWISDSVDFTILDISDYDPPHVPSKTWRELIKKVWEIDPLTCPRCGSDLPAIGFAIRRGGRVARSSGEAGGDADYQPDPGS